MARPISGSVRFVAGRWVARISRPGGKEQTSPFDWLNVNDAEGKAKALDEAQKLAKALHVRIASKATAATPQAGESLRDWSLRWVESRKAKRDTTSDLNRLRPHIWPFFEGRAMRDIARADVQRFVRYLDDRIHSNDPSHRLASKTARNIFAVLTKMFRDAHRSKITELVVRDDNPASDVEGPDREAQREFTFLFPSEFQALMACESVALSWRRTIALSLYLGTRPGELAALTWADIDLAHARIRIHRAEKRSTGEIKKTKTKLERTINIEPALLPLLRVMRDEVEGEGRVVARMPGPSSCASMFRDGLQKAGCVRPELFATDETRQRIRAYDLRASCATWRAVRNDHPNVIQEHLGHTDIATTMKYIRKVQNLRANFGEVFQALPKCLLGETSSVELSENSCVTGLNTGLECENAEKQGRPQRDLNPRTYVVERRPSLFRIHQPRSNPTSDDGSAHPSDALSENEAGNTLARSEVVHRLSRLIADAAKRSDFATVQSLTTALEAILAAPHASPAQAVNGPSSLPLKLS